MFLKSIYVALSGVREADSVAQSALILAKEFNSHVIGSDTVAEPGPFLDQTGVGMMATYYDELYKSAEKVQAHKRSVASEVFEKARQSQSVDIKEKAGPDIATCYWYAHDGDADIVARLGRLADLIVVACPGEESAYADLQTLEHAMFDARRPVLMVPQERHFDPSAPIVTAWNGSTEAARALINAIPLMKSSGKATLIQVGDLSPGSTELADAESYLNLHGVQVEVILVAEGGESTADILLKKCQEIEAGCLVMGAYTHNPWKEMILGGVTKHMTQHAPLPILFAH